MPKKEKTFEELLEKSSLGTPRAVALRNRADPKIVQKILDRVDELEREDSKTDKGSRLVDFADVALDKWLLVDLEESLDVEEAMAGMNEQKELQREEETELLEELVRSKLDVVFQEMILLARTTALKHEEALGLVGEAFSRFATGLAIDGGESKLEFLKSIAETFDELMVDDDDPPALKVIKEDDGLAPS